MDYINKAKMFSAAAYSATATADATDGGFLQITSGSYTMNGGSISGATGNYGGAIYVGNGVTLTLNGVNITNCNGVLGGAIYVEDGGTLFLNGCNISNCNASSRGGAICVYGDGYLAATGGSITNCTATTQGGAIYNNPTTTSVKAISLNSLTISDCTAAGGGAIASYNALTNVTNCTIYNCSTTRDGGAIEAYYGISLFNTTIYDCETKYGGGLCVGGNSIISGGSIYSCSATNGGGIYVRSGSSVTITGGAVIGGSSNQNWATEGGGGIYVVANATLYLDNCTIAYNSALIGGGVGCAETATSAIIDIGKSTIIRNNNAWSGGGVYVGSAATLNISGGTIQNNAATVNYGGGVYVQGADSSAVATTIVNMTSASSSILGNLAPKGGGGIYMDYATLNMVDGTINQNQSFTDGGGVYANNYSVFNMMGGTIGNAGVTIAATSTDYGNSATSNGGGVAIYANSAFNMLGGNISYNYTKTYGGAVYSYSSSGPTSINISGGTFSYNSATWGGAIGILNMATLIVKGGNFANNNLNASVSGSGGKSVYWLFMGTGTGTIYTALTNISQSDFSSNYSAVINFVSATDEIGKDMNIGGSIDADKGMDTSRQIYQTENTQMAQQELTSGTDESQSNDYNCDIHKQDIILDKRQWAILLKKDCQTTEDEEAV